MKRNSVGVFAGVVALVTIVAVLVLFRQNQQLNSELNTLRDAAVQAEAMAAVQQQRLSDARLGNALICRLALNEGDGKILEFVRAIPQESLSCRTMDLPEYSLQLLWFHYDQQLPDGSTLPPEKCKSAALLLNPESLEVVDYVLHDGFSSVSKSSVEPYYVLNKEQPDGTSVGLVVTPSGFEPVK